MALKSPIILLLALTVAYVQPAETQQPKIPRIGYVSSLGDSNNPGFHVEAFRQGLRDLGYIEAKNILIEYRYPEGIVDRIPSLLAELVQLKIDLLVVTNPSTIRAAKQATKTIPIVMVTTQDPVEAGIVDSLARPGGNITGLTRRTRELSGKRLELLKEVVPRISRIGVLWAAPAIAPKEYDAEAGALKITLQSLKVHGPNPDLEAAFREAVKGRVNALITPTNLLLSRYSKQIAALAIRNRLPSMYEASNYVHAGGLMSYAADDAEIFKRAAVYVDKILKGTKPADLPVERPIKFELLINLKTAKALSLTIPPGVMMQADKVIE
jgi:putative ABC transport system substrate-binding protein